VVPGKKPVMRGPYRWIRHPNYLVVVTEILVIPILCGAYLTPAAFSAINASWFSLGFREEEAASPGLGVANLSRLPRFIPNALSGPGNSVSRRESHDLPLGREDGTA